MDAQIGRRFVDTMRSWLISLPHDLKILYEAAADANLDRASRELAIGAIIYVISPNDFIASDRQDFSGYADDCLVLRPLAQPVLDAELARHSEHAASLRGVDLTPMLDFVQPLVAERPRTQAQLRTAIAGPRRVAWRQAVRRDLEAALPPAVRERTLIVVAQPSPHYVDQLTRDERARLAGLVRQSIAVLEEAGYEAMEEGDGLTAADFADRIHLAPAGGVKLADRLAPRVRAMAERLGYVR